MEVSETAANLCGVEAHSVFVQFLLHVVDVKLQVSAAHHGQDHAQSVLRLVGVRQVHLHTTPRSPLQQNPTVRLSLIQIIIIIQSAPDISNKADNPGINF